MLIPLSWLRDLVEFQLPTPELVTRLTLAGLEVASVQSIGDAWDPETIVVGQVQAVLPHPDADRLVLVDVDYGGEEAERVVTGAPNLFQYRGAEPLPVLKVAFARAGALLVDAYSDQRPRPQKKLKPSKIRGVKSAGMVCSELELGLSEEHEGILLLPEVAPVGVALRDYLGDEVLELELTPDMARCLNLIGVAREVSGLTDATLRLPADELQSSGDDQATDYVEVRIEDSELCNRYTGIVIRDVTMGDSPAWMQERLRKAGMRPINNIVDITNYVMLEWGQPLHAFDYDTLQARAARVGEAKPTIIVRRAQAGEKFTTLDGIERELDETMLMIADRAGSVAIAGVMGGLESEVSATTRTVLLESATFEGINNRRTAQALRMSSEASYRFTRGIPASLNPIAARRAAELMRIYAGGRVVPGIVDVYPVEQPELLVYTTASDMARILGMQVTLDDAAAALEKLDFRTGRVETIAATASAEATFALHRLDGEPLLACNPPWHRLDVRIPADLIEEVARMIGYEKVGTTLMVDELPTQHRNQMLQTEEKIRDTLVSAGLQENINHPLTTADNHRKLTPGATDGQEAAYISITNPSVESRRSMRRTLAVSALESLARNLRYVSRLTTFEVGRVYLPEAGEGPLPREVRRVSILLTGARQAEDFYREADGSQEMDFFDLKGVVETLVQYLGFPLSDLEFRAQPDTPTFGPRCAEVFLDGGYLGILGEVHPQVRSAFGLPSVRVCLAELDIAPLIRPHWEMAPLPAISNYPPVMEDLAFEVDEDVTVRQVQETMRTAGGALVTEIELFDIYRGEPLAVNHKSLAFRLTYQSAEKSLAEKEIAKLRQRIIAAVEDVTHGKLRS